MEVMIPAQDFDFNSSCTSPYSSAPSTPKRFGEYFFSAPTSPTRISDFYRDFEDFSASNGDVFRSGSQSPAVPYKWELSPGTPKMSSSKSKKAADHDNDDRESSHDDFAFDFSADLERSSLSAEELFDGGKIRPLKPPPRLQLVEKPIMRSPNRSPKAQKRTVNDRGRERNTNSSSGGATAYLASSNSGRRATRSLSPLRVAQYPWEEEEAEELRRRQQQVQPKQNDRTELALVSKRQWFSSNSTAASSSSSKSNSSSKKWRLKDFFLFRSASEGRATEKDPLRKYYSKKYYEDNNRNSSFRSTESFRRSKGPAVSAHELHYTVNKAVSEDLKKKTFLPYKQGILGRLAFNPAVHALANGFGSLTRT